MKHPDCPFCRIIAGELPAHILYENADILVFLDINPVLPGHALVIPKEHVVNAADASDAVLAKVVAAAAETGRTAIKRLDAAGFNLLNANGRAAQQSVFHLHFHVIPRYPSDPVNLWIHGRRGGGISLDEVARRYGILQIS